MGRPKNTVPTPEPPKRRWVTQAFVAAHLNITTRTVRDMTTDGRLRGYRLNPKFVRYDLNEVDAAMTPFGGSVSTCETASGSKTRGGQSPDHPTDRGDTPIATQMPTKEPNAHKGDTQCLPLTTYSRNSPSSSSSSTPGSPGR
jgi:hypothetical protein